jgi:hypothetical protein
MDVDQTVVHQGNYTEYTELINKLWKWTSKQFVCLPYMLLNSVKVSQLWPQCKAKQLLSNYCLLSALWPFTSAVTWQNYLERKCEITEASVHFFYATSLNVYSLWYVWVWVQLSNFCSNRPLWLHLGMNAHPAKQTL